jgi:hypothetical protein
VADQVSDLAHGRFQRAIRNLRRGAMAARELGRVSLTDPLALTSRWVDVSESPGHCWGSLSESPPAPPPDEGPQV